jgi:hypothetical protein
MHAGSPSGERPGRRVHKVSYNRPMATRAYDENERINRETTWRGWGKEGIET